MQAMILAAGKGTRLQPITRHTPKALVAVGGKPLLQWHLERLEAEGFEHVVVNVHHHAEQVMEWIACSPWRDSLCVSDEREALLDTGGGLQHALPLLMPHQPVLLHNVDILTTLSPATLYRYHLTTTCAATLAVQRRSSSRYLLFDSATSLLCGHHRADTDTQRLCSNPAGTPQRLAFSGVHVVSPELLQCLEPGVYSITEHYLQHCTRLPIGYFDHSEQVWLDVGRPDTFTAAQSFPFRLLTNTFEPL